MSSMGAAATGLFYFLFIVNLADRMADGQSVNLCRVGSLGGQSEGGATYPLSQHIFILHKSHFNFCYGRLRNVRFQLYGISSVASTHANMTIYLSFWRPTSNSLKLKSIGNIIIPLNATRIHDTICEYDASSDDIILQQGDQMGVWMEGPVLKLKFLIFSRATSLVEPVRLAVQAAEVGTVVSFPGYSSRHVAAIELSIIRRPTFVTPSTDTIPSNTTNSATSSVTTPTDSSTTPTDSSTTPTDSSTTPTDSSTTPTDSSTTPTDSSTTPTNSTEDSSSTTLTTDIPATSGPTTTGPPEVSRTPENTTSLNDTHLEDHAKMTSSALDVRTLAISMGVGLGILLAVAIAIILVLIRQWKVRGRPFALATHLVQSSSFASTQGISSPDNGSAVGPGRHIYHTVDRNSKFYSSDSSDSRSSSATYVSRSSSVAANPLYVRVNQLSTVDEDSESVTTQKQLTEPGKQVKGVNSPYTYTVAPVEKRQPGKGRKRSEDDYWSPPRSEVELYGIFQNKKYRMIPRKDISVLDDLGEGQFGTVAKGTWIQKNGTSIQVAVKTLRKTASVISRLKFLQEAAIMGQFNHPSIVKLYGVVLKEEPIMIVLEILLKGDLKHYLQELQHQKAKFSMSFFQKKFLAFAQQIAAGMNYLSNKGFIHRDLAARNILMADEETCKIGDFGLARDLANGSHYSGRGGRIPVKWTALEAILYNKYATASDVWSYGIVLYEMWSLGSSPYEGMTTTNIITFLKKGSRLSPPPGTPRAIYQLMMQCWHQEPERRPDFSALLVTLNNLYDEVLFWGKGKKEAEYQIGEDSSYGKDLHYDLQCLYLQK